MLHHRLVAVLKKPSMHHISSFPHLPEGAIKHYLISKPLPCYQDPHSVPHKSSFSFCITELRIAGEIAEQSGLERRRWISVHGSVIDMHVGLRFDMCFYKIENGEVYQRRRGPSAGGHTEEQEVSPKAQEVRGQTGSSSWRRIVLLILAITIHNIPEGLAVGVGFGAIGKTPSATFESARNLAIGIGIQNFPEGLAVSLPLRGSGVSTWRSFWYGQLSGMVEPLAGLLGAVAVVLAEPLLPYALAFAAGAMVYVVLDDIIPEAQIRQWKRETGLLDGHPGFCGDDVTGCGAGLRPLIGPGMSADCTENSHQSRLVLSVCRFVNQRALFLHAFICFINDHEWIMSD
nr:uncharacterized protein LOC110440161 [Danio rerio]|eukprot:XP_021336137.1 uncharacterized protein LOC110440161 [Danio rerio]